MKRKIVALLLAASLLTMGLSGCGAETSSEPASEPTVTSEATETASTTEESSASEMQVVTVWSDSAHSQTMRDAQIEEFNNTIGKEKGIKIEYTVYGSDYADTINVALMANDGPDLFSPSSRISLLLSGSAHL